MNEKILSISEVSELLGYENHVLRYYEKEFKLDIPRNEVNHRYYTDKEINLLKRIKELQEKGYSNKQIKLILRSPDLIENSTNEACVTVLMKDNKLRSRDESNLHGNNINYEISVLEDLKEEIVGLLNKQLDKDKDILISENAKLKLKLKEKTYEIMRLKEKLNDKEGSNKKKFLFFRKKK